MLIGQEKVDKLNDKVLLLKNHLFQGLNYDFNYIKRLSYKFPLESFIKTPKPFFEEGDIPKKIYIIKSGFIDVTFSFYIFNHNRSSKISKR